MHILMTADAMGGVWTYTRELVTQLSRRRVRVTLVTFGEIPSPAQSEWVEGLAGVSYHPTAFRLEWMFPSKVPPSCLARATSFFSYTLNTSSRQGNHKWMWSW